MPAKECFTALPAGRGEQDRFGLPNRIADQPLCVEPAQGIPVVPFPSAAFVVEGEKEQRKHHLVDFVLIAVHAVKLALFEARFNCELREREMAGRCARRPGVAAACPP